MKNKIYLLSFFLVVLVLQNGYSQDDRWRYIVSDAKTSMFLDTKTVSKLDLEFSDRVFEIWMKYSCLKDCFVSSHGSILEYWMIRFQVDCRNRQIRLVEWISYYSDQSNNKFPYPEEWETVVPETCEEAILEHICTYY